MTAEEIYAELERKGWTNTVHVGDPALTMGQVLDLIPNKGPYTDLLLEVPRLRSQLREAQYTQEQYSNRALKAQLDRIEELARQGRMF